MQILQWTVVFHCRDREIPIYTLTQSTVEYSDRSLSCEWDFIRLVHSLDILLSQKWVKISLKLLLLKYFFEQQQQML